MTMKCGEGMIFAADCPSRALLDQIVDKWSMIILKVLGNEPMRFNSLKRQLEGVTQKALVQALRRMERNGLVTRRVLPISPVGVEYQVTPLGRSLQGPFTALFDWTIEYLPQVEEARRNFDGGDAPEPDIAAAK